MIKLLATDIDGTLLNDNREVSSSTIKAFKDLHIPKILISARMPQAMTHLQEDLKITDHPMICYNGALVISKDQSIVDITIPFNTISDFVEIARTHNLHCSIYRGKEWFVPELDFWANREINNTKVEPVVQDYGRTLEYFNQTRHKGGAHKIMLMGDEEFMDLAFAKAEYKKLPVHLYRSKNTYTEITPNGISKIEALKELLKHDFSNITVEQVVAFGDNYNDVTMIKEVGYGIAVDNARDKVKEVAAEVTDHHKQDGVANWLIKNSRLFQ